MPRKWKERETSPERTKVWIEPSGGKQQHQAERKVAVVYYLSRNGQLEQPHFMEVPLSSPGGLYLRGKQTTINNTKQKTGQCLVFEDEMNVSSFVQIFKFS